MGHKLPSVPDSPVRFQLWQNGVFLKKRGMHKGNTWDFGVEKTIHALITTYW